jgi:branched chain amino acid efflux pump
VFAGVAIGVLLSTSRPNLRGTGKTAEASR